MSRRQTMPKGRRQPGSVTSNGSGAEAAKSGAEALRQEVERLIQRQRFKDAFKQAKLCYRKEESPDNHRLLERTYWLRVQELSRGGMPTAAAEIAGNLLEFGVTDSKVLAELVLLLPSLGMADKAQTLMLRLDSPHVHTALSLKIADRAVLSPEQTPDSMPELRAGGLQVRAALAALDADNEALATEQMRDVPRSSPFADWRYFVRGLAAFRRGESEQAAVNWERLDPERAAHKIARVLQRSTIGDSSGFMHRGGEDQSLLEVSAFGEPVLARLEQLRVAVAENDWKEAVRLIGPLRLSLHRIDPRMAERLTDILLRPLIDRATCLNYESAERFVREFTKAAQALPIDPHWNRLWALLWQGTRDGLEGAARYWRAYVQDLDTLPILSTDQRRRAQALVWKHLGREYADCATPDMPAALLESEGELEPSDYAIEAIECINKSLQLDPNQHATHELLIYLYETWNRSDDAVAAARQMLHFFPDDVNPLRVLFHYHASRDEPEMSLPYLEQLRAIKPLDEGFAADERGTRAALARQYAKAGRWEEGRAQFALLETRFPDSQDDFRFWARKAMFEFKAGQPAQAEKLLTASREHMEEPAILWLFLSIEARRYGLSEALKKLFDDPFKAQLDKKARGEIAGGFADVLLPFLEAQASYPGRDWHINEVVRYLGKTTRIKYRQADLEVACRLLALVPEGSLLLEKLTRRGLKMFRESPVFPFFCSIVESKKGPYECNYEHIRKHLRAALALLESNPDSSHSDSNYPGLAETIKRQLIVLDDVADSISSFRRFPNFEGRGRGAGLPPEIKRMMAAMFNELEDGVPDFDPLDFGPSGGDFSDNLFDPTPGGSRPEARKPNRKKR